MLREVEDELRDTDELLLREAELLLELRETEPELLREVLVLLAEVLSPRLGALLLDEAWLREAEDWLLREPEASERDTCPVREPLLLLPLRATRVLALSNVRLLFALMRAASSRV